MTVTVGNGSYRYDVAEDWGKLPEGYESAIRRARESAASK